MKRHAKLRALAEAYLAELGSVETQSAMGDPLEKIWRDGDIPDDLDRATANLLRVLLRDGLYQELPEFLHLARKEHLRAHRTLEASVVSARPLASEERTRLMRALEKRWGTRVELRERVESSLLGGIRVQTDAWHYDATVRGRLDRLARRLVGSQSF